MRTIQSSLIPTAIQLSWRAILAGYFEIGQRQITMMRQGPTLTTSLQRRGTVLLMLRELASLEPVSRMGDAPIATLMEHRKCAYLTTSSIRGRHYLWRSWSPSAAKKLPLLCWYGRSFYESPDAACQSMCLLSVKFVTIFRISFPIRNGDIVQKGISNFTQVKFISFFVLCVINHCPNPLSILAHQLSSNSIKVWSSIYGTIFFFFAQSRIDCLFLTNGIHCLSYSWVLATCLALATVVREVDFRCCPMTEVFQK